MISRSSLKEGFRFGILPNLIALAQFRVTEYLNCYVKNIISNIKELVKILFNLAVVYYKYAYLFRYIRRFLTYNRSQYGLVFIFSSIDKQEDIFTYRLAPVNQRAVL